MERFKDHLSKLGIVTLRPEQSQALQHVFAGFDQFIVLPTGFGKSICYQMAPFCSDPPSKVIIIMPLEALMKQQHQRLLSSGFNAVIVKSTDDAHSVLQKDAMVTHIFISPEVFCDFFVPAAIESADTSLFSHVFVDESHCVANWGLSDKRTTAFRGKFALIGRIRSVMPEAAMVAMTATATVAVERQVCDLLQMTDYKTLRRSPDKSNLRYSVVKIEGGVDKCFEWLSKELSSGTCPKTLVFVRMLDHVGKIFRHLEAEVPEGSIAMYHSRISEQGKADITAKFCSTEDSVLKCVVCTSAFSMGMDIADIRRIVHYGAPSSLDEYVQEVGRGGRDGQECEAAVILHRHALSGSVDDESKAYVKTEDCRRHFILKTFDSNVPKPSPTVNCCDNCLKTATSCCHDKAIKCYCVKAVMPCYMQPVKEQDPSVICRSLLSPSAIQACKNDLNLLNTPTTSVPHNVTSIYPELIDKILARHQYIDNHVANIMALGAYSLEQAQAILNVLNKHSKLTLCDSFASLVLSDTESDTTMSDSD